MARPKQRKAPYIKELEDKIKILESANKSLESTLTSMQEQADESFLTSPTYIQMQREIDYLKSLNAVSESNLASAKKRELKFDERCIQVYEDNKRLCEHQDNAEYWVGITEHFHEAQEYEKLRDEICELKGKLEAKEKIIEIRDKEIEKLQTEISGFHHEKYKAETKLEGEVQKQRTLRIKTKSELQEIKNLLQKEQSKRYDIYVPEDAASYYDLQSQLQDAKNQIDLISGYNQSLKRDIEILQKQIVKLSSTLPSKQAAEMISGNIATSKDFQMQPKKGRPCKMDSYKIALIHELRASGHTIRDIAKHLGVSVGTVQRYAKQEY